MKKSINTTVYALFWFLSFFTFKGLFQCPLISSGYFGKRFKDILDRYGANTTLLEASLGEAVALKVIEHELKTK
jgi:hypothetical protein